MHARPLVGSAGALLALSVAVTGCSSGADSRKNDAAQDESPSQALTATKKKVDAAKSVHMTLTASALPKGVQGVISGEGSGTHKPDFKGTFKLQVAGVKADVPVVAIGDKMWAKPPIWKEMRRLDPKKFGVPNPASYFSRDTGLTTLLPKTQGAKFGKEQRDGADVVRPISGTLPGKQVVNSLGVGDPNGQFKVTYQVTEEHELRTVKITGHFYDDHTTTYTVRLDRYGADVSIAPPA